LETFKRMSEKLVGHISDCLGEESNREQCPEEKASGIRFGLMGRNQHE